MREGRHVYSPIAHTHPIAIMGGLPLGWDYWEPFDRKMIAACDELWVLQIDGWDRSLGIAAEVQIATELGKTIRYIDEQGAFTNG